MHSSKDGKPSPWRFATRIVTSNKEVDVINKSQLVRFARDHGKPVYFWQCEPTGSDGDCTIGDNMSLLVDDVRGMIQYFVEGAPCMVTKNTYMKHGVANGTVGTMHSLSWEDAADTPVSANYKPGQLIRVRQPYSVHVALTLNKSGQDEVTNSHVKDNSNARKNGKRPTKLSSANTSDKNKKCNNNAMMVVPIIRKSHKFTVIKYNRKTKRPAKGLSCYTHHVAPIFAVTFHKAQGQTLTHVVLHLHKHPGRSLKGLQFQGLYVALSRVEQGSHLRVVYDEHHGLKHLYHLRRPKNFDLWINNYCDRSGQWQRQGLNDLRKKKIQGVRKQLKRTGNLLSLSKKSLIDIARVMDIKVEKNSRGATNKQEYVNALYDVWINEKKQKNESVGKRSNGLNLASEKKRGQQKPKKANITLPKKRACVSCIKPTTRATSCVEHDMNIRRKYFKQIQEGSKTVEGRPNFPDLGRIKSGDIIRFKVCGWTVDIESHIREVEQRELCLCVPEHVGCCACEADYWTLLFYCVWSLTLPCLTVPEHVQS